MLEPSTWPLSEGGVLGGVVGVVLVVVEPLVVGTVVMANKVKCVVWALTLWVVVLTLETKETHLFSVVEK